MQEFKINNRWKNMENSRPYWPIDSIVCICTFNIQEQTEKWLWSDDFLLTPSLCHGIQ